MKKGILIGLAVLLTVGVLLGHGIATSNTEVIWFTPDVAFAASSGNETYEAMIVFYTIPDEMYMFWCDLDAEIKDKGDTWDVKSDQVNAKGISKDKATYGYFMYKEITPIYDEEGNVIPQYMADLNLEPMGAEGLPESGHYARLDAVHPGDALKAEVARYFEGQWYLGIRCLVTLSVLQAYQAGDIVIGDYMWV